MYRIIIKENENGDKRIISIYNEVPSLDERVLYPNFLGLSYNVSENITDIDDKIEIALKKEGLDVIRVLKGIEENTVELCFQIRAKIGINEIVERVLKSVSITESRIIIDPLWNQINRKYE